MKTRARTLLVLGVIPFLALTQMNCGSSKPILEEEPPLPEIQVEEPAPTPPAPRPVPKDAEVKMPPPKPIFLLNRIHFDLDQHFLTGEAQRVLSENAEVLRAYPDVSIVVEGHCDERGTVEYNLALGDKRARAARDYLIQLGVAPGRVRTISYGKERPIEFGSTERAWSMNRRAEFRRQ